MATSTPSTSSDTPKEAYEIMQEQIATGLNKIIILSTHDINAALEYATHCWIMQEDKSFSVIGRESDFEQQVLHCLKY